MVTLKRRKFEPLQEGTLLTIYKKFFHPLLTYKPHNMGLDEWYQGLWGIKNTDILKMRALKKFEIPGYIVTNIGEGPDRVVPKGTVVLVRLSVDSTNLIDIELLNRPRRPSQVYRLSREEWGRVRRNFVDISKE